MTHLSPDEMKKLEARLNRQRLDLVSGIREHLHQGGDGGAPGLANHFAEVREQAEAGLLADNDIGKLRLQMDELTGVEAALARAAAGSYAICTRCSMAIAPQRMRALPAAEMCLACQKIAEQLRQGPGSAVL